MAVPGLTTALYLFAIMSMATVVVILAHFFSAKNEISFAVVYIWKTTVLVFALISMIWLTILRKNTNHLKEVPDQSRRSASKITRDGILLLCGTGSGVLPLYEAWQDFPCTSSKIELTFYISKFISLVLSGIFFLLELVFLACFRKYRCNSGRARVLVSVIFSANVCMLTNFILNIIRASNTNTKQLNLGNRAEDYTEVLVFSYCENKTEHLDNTTTVAEQLYKYTNTFVLEFGLFALGILGPVWNVIAQTPDRNINRAGSNDDVSSVGNPSYYDDDDDNALITHNGILVDNAQSWRFRMVKALKKTLIFVSKHSFIFTLLLVLPVLGFHVYSDVHNLVNKNSDIVLEKFIKNETFEQGNYYVQTGYNYIVSIIPFIGYLIARGSDISSWCLNSDNVLLVASGCGHLLLVLFETADSIAGFLSSTDQSEIATEIMYFVKILFHYIGIYFQIMIITKARAIAKDQSKRQRNKRLFINGIIIFLGVCNMERWLADSFLPPINLSYVNDIQNEDTLGVKNWWFITEFLFPVVAFYRLLSALLCFEVRDLFHEAGI
ncbi:uncharacterized protein LOC123550038 [Mercenaria mercenaria]|uniref:uncharacterized protein LOC123550038 n=1 Tax=Mercenaria mercenaria TaxID=6596 RepID=UPI00234FADE1|nr:uncharacterized protein LOC123550038 [Mercenaria mercenaria]